MELRRVPAQMRQLLVVSVWWAFVWSPTSGLSASLDTLSSRDAAGGLRAALSQGIDTAVAQLGAPNGFLNDPKVSIPLPPALEKADRALRMVGMGADADALKAAMNHAAETAVADAKPVEAEELAIVIASLAGRPAQDKRA